jgi:general secretion pathway protein G
MLDRFRKVRGEEGFTLIELLIAIIILAVLAGIVVFAVAGISDKGQTSACKTDKKTLATAEEAYYAKKFEYTDGPGLVAGGLLQEDSAWYTLTPNNASDPKTYTFGRKAGAPSECT